MRYKSQAIVGLIGAVFCISGVILSLIFLTESTGFWWVIPAFLIPFMLGFLYYAYASMKEKKEKKYEKEEKKLKKFPDRKQEKKKK